MQKKSNALVITLLFIIVILLGYIAFSKNTPDAINRNVTPVNNEVFQNEDVVVKDNVIKDYIIKPKLVKYQFLKDIVANYVDSTIWECSYKGQNVFAVSIDRVQNGSHIVGGALGYYYSNGIDIGSCPLYPFSEKPQICNEVNLESCNVIYSTVLGRYQNIDIYNLK